MSDQNEQERLKQLRDRQLSARDPLVKQKQFQRTTAIKEKRMRKSFSLIEAWRELPHVIRTPFYGLLLGLAVIIILPEVWASTWAILTSIGATLILIIFGLVVGNSLDIRDRLRDHLKK